MTTPMPHPMFPDVLPKLCDPAWFQVKERNFLDEEQIEAMEELQQQKAVSLRSKCADNPVIGKPPEEGNEEEEEEEAEEEDESELNEEDDNDDDGLESDFQALGDIESPAEEDSDLLNM